MDAIKGAESQVNVGILVTIELRVKEFDQGNK